MKLHVNPDEIRILSDYIHKISGIFLDINKGYLIETRLNTLAQEEGCSSFFHLYMKAKNDSSKNIERKIIDRMTTNETLFFRDMSPFEMFQYKIIPELIDRRSVVSAGSLPTHLRIWSAACSTGQEVYSIAMVLKEMLRDIGKYNIRLLGTDISDAAIARASYGHYNRFEIDRGLEKKFLNKYFKDEGNRWKIRDDIRAMATFKKINLMDSFSGLGKFDVIFCRNVAIYFTPEDRNKLFEKIAHIMEPDGYLIIGSTESLTGVSPQFVPQRHLRSVFYRLKKRGG
ncbi:MAG: protein-glutamate O-methyltransferase CheR [Deltaproteobacteria bacterium]|nr:protein-glutamate O-methyltransferase CheR [Deltaproteobacteria bacterium]